VLLNKLEIKKSENFNELIFFDFFEQDLEYHSLALRKAVTWGCNGAVSKLDKHFHNVLEIRTLLISAFT